MNVAIIGCSGHYGYALEAVGSGVDIICVSPGPESRDISPLINALSSVGAAPRIYSDHITMLESEKNIDLAVVNPWFCHAAQTSIDCLSRGVGVYSEKPLATTIADLNRLEAVYESSGHPLGGMFALRGEPWYLALRRAVRSGEIGAVKSVAARKSYKLGSRDELYRSRETFGGIIPWVAIHAIDWAVDIGGKCARVAALSNCGDNRGNGDLDMVSTTIIEHEGGAISTVTADFLRPDGAASHADDRLIVTGTEGVLEAGSGEVFIENSGGRSRIELPVGRSHFVDFMDAISVGRARVMAEDAIYVTRVALAARDAADAGVWMSL